MHIRLRLRETTSMITAHQLRAARALLNIDQRQTADLADLSVPTIQRMEASDGVIRANVDSLMKLVAALENAGIELINPGVPSPSGGRGVRLREHVAKPKMKSEIVSGAEYIKMATEKEESAKTEEARKQAWRDSSPARKAAKLAKEAEA